MTRQNFERILSALHRRLPFRPFGVIFENGNRIEVDHPEALVLRAGVAVYVSKHGVPTLFDHESVSEVLGEAREVRRG